MLGNLCNFQCICFLFAVSLDVIPVGADLVKIWGVEAELFLMIDDAGLLRATVSHFDTCV